MSAGVNLQMDLADVRAWYFVTETDWDCGRYVAWVSSRGEKRVLPNLSRPGRDGLRAILYADRVGSKDSFCALVDRLIFWESSPHGGYWWSGVYTRGYLSPSERREIERIVGDDLRLVEMVEGFVFEEV